MIALWKFQCWLRYICMQVHGKHSVWVSSISCWCCYGCWCTETKKWACIHDACRCREELGWTNRHCTTYDIWRLIVDKLLIYHNFLFINVKIFAIHWFYCFIDLIYKHLYTFIYYKKQFIICNLHLLHHAFYYCVLILETNMRSAVVLRPKSH